MCFLNIFFKVYYLSSHLLNLIFRRAKILNLDKNQLIHLKKLQIVDLVLYKRNLYLTQGWKDVSSRYFYIHIYDLFCVNVCKWHVGQAEVLSLFSNREIFFQNILAWFTEITLFTNFLYSPSRKSIGHMNSSISGS